MAYDDRGAAHATKEAREQARIRIEARVASFNALAAAAKAYAFHLDQFEKFRFETDYGPVYVSIKRQDEYPESFDAV